MFISSVLLVDNMHTLQWVNVTPIVRKVRYKGGYLRSGTYYPPRSPYSYVRPQCLRRVLGAKKFNGLSNVLFSFLLIPLENFLLKPRNFSTVFLFFCFSVFLLFPRLPISDIILNRLRIRIKFRDFFQFKKFLDFFAANSGNLSSWGCFKKQLDFDFDCGGAVTRLSNVRYVTTDRYHNPAYLL